MSSAKLVIGEWIPSSFSDLTFAHGIICGGIIGATTTLAIFSLRTAPNTKDKDAPIEGDDECFSLFYDKVPGEDGVGFPSCTTCSLSTKLALTTVYPEYRRLPNDIYSQVVEKLPLFCIDVICRRKCDGKIVLFYRRDNPASNIWWWPGGRMYRGETFYTSAIRKLSEELGILPEKISPKAIVQIWNTFFPNSSFDNGRTAGREGTQTVNIVILVELSADHQAISAIEEAKSLSAKEKWAVTDERWCSVPELCTVGKYDKYVRLNVEIAKRRGLL
mmetsp:Transcript_5633/g.5832  ORF Transcript_5633/g.5832 Transcript_5633/m.5832 type:complete len:275 (+) Transcript_5633:54-878(+)